MVIVYIVLISFGSIVVMVKSINPGQRFLLRVGGVFSNICVCGEEGDWKESVGN